MHVEEGSFKAKEDRNGNRYFLHRLTDNTSFAPAIPTASK
jgi:hypothetical protein